ncbi:MAG: carboxypeptidase regulatory-like domain-containing protein [Patescibacteria group bacterium]
MSLQTSVFSFFPVLAQKIRATRSCIGFVIIAMAFFVSYCGQAYAAITVEGPPIDELFQNVTVGGGAILPMVRFRLTQSSGADTVSKVGFTINASTTMTQGEVARVSLWMESGTQPGFQIEKDTFLAGAASTSPMVDGTLIVLTPTNPVSVGSTGGEFYIIATTTAASGITNGHGFDVRMSANYASTTSGGIGTAFTPQRKVTLNQTAPVKISEVRMGTVSSAADEFVELHNTSEVDIDMRHLGLTAHIFYANGSSSPVALKYFKTVLPEHGYFLIAAEYGYGGAAVPDAVFSTTTADILFANGGFSIATTSGNGATSTAIDRVGWGTQQAANCENADTAGTVCAPVLANNGGSIERLALGYPDATSTETTMAIGGTDATKGNGIDRNDNSADFIAQTISVNPQNSASPPEFSFGGGGQDSEKPFVVGSFPGQGSTGVPLDLGFIGFGFNKMVASGTIQSGSATTTVTLTGGSSTNLCTSVTYNPFPSNYEPPAKCNLSASLSANTTYTFVATSTIYDLSGNALDQNSFSPGNQAYSATFTTGAAGQTQTNITPPHVLGTTPFQGSINIPTNLAKIAVKFNGNMDGTTLISTNITLGGVSLSSFSFDATTTTLTFVPGTLSANTAYTLTLGTGVKNSNGIALPAAYTSTFTTGASADYTGPAVQGVIPALGSTLKLNAVNFIVVTDDALDSTTATTGAVTLSYGGSNLPGTVKYDSVSGELFFTGTNLLPVNTTVTLTLVGGALKNITGSSTSNQVFNWTTETTNSDSTGPTVLFANCDSFGCAITFDEAVKEADATTLANYALFMNSATTTPSALAGHSASYDAARRTVKISGLLLAPGTAYTATVSNVRDISGNAMSGSASVSGTILSYASSGGFLGPGEQTGSYGPNLTDFSSSGIGFMPGFMVMAMNAFISASTTYGFEIPLSKQIPANGTIVVSFPSTSDYDLCCAATSSATNPFVSESNRDINGPGAGTIGVKTIAVSNTAKTVTLTLDTATRSESSDTHDFLRLALVDIKNPSIAKGINTSGYTIELKTKDASGVVLESFTSNPVFINGGGAGSATTTVSGNVKGNGTNLVGVTIRIMSPQIGMLESTTDSSGNYSFANVPVNTISSYGNAGSEYYLFTDPVVRPSATSVDFFGETIPTPVLATSSTSTVVRNYTLTPTSSAITFTVNLTGDNSSNGIFRAGEQLDVFAGGPSRFVLQTVTSGAVNYSGTFLTKIPIPQVNGSWGLGIGPAMPKGMGSMDFGPPPAPGWVVPRPVEIIVAGCPSACAATIDGAAASSRTFTVSAADKTITGILQDDSAKVLSNADVFAFSAAQGVGNRAQTSPAGVFTIKVGAGSYNVGAFIPGMGNSREVPVLVDSSGNVYVDGSTGVSTGATGGNPFILKMKKPSYTITGRVSDGTSAVANAPVFAYRTDLPGHTDALTDSSGNYTLYVDSGSWKVNVFIPGFGAMSEQTVTVTTASKADINFSPSTATTFYRITGTVYESADADIATSTETVSGVIVRVTGTNGTNEAVTGSDGTFTIRIPAGSYTIADIFKPGYGRIAALDQNLAAIGTLNASAGDVYTPIRIATRRTITVNIKDSSGAALTVARAFIDLFDATKNFGNHAEITNGTTTTMQIADGASSTIRVFIEGVPPTNVSAASDDAGTLVLSGVLQVNGNEIIKITINTNTAALSTVTGTIYSGSASAGNELAEAWVQFVDATNNVHFGTQATSSGTYSIRVANGTYQVVATRPGYVGTPTSLTVSADTSTANFVVTQAAAVISGTVKRAGTAVSDAFVWAEKKGGGFAATRSSTDGTYTLRVDSGTWAVYAAADGYQKAAYASNPVAVGSSGIDFNLTSTVSISSKVVTSNTFTDSSTGTMEDTTLGVTVSLDSGALGNSGTNGYISVKETSNLPETLDTNLINDTGFDIDAVNGSSAVTTLQTGKSAEISLTYTKAELATDGIDTTTEVANLKLVSWSDDKRAWESLTTVATYLDSSGAPVASPSSDLSNVSSVQFTTASADHFSEYALSTPSDASAPATPTGLVATQSSTNKDVAVSWTANTESDLSGYYIYRDTTPSGSFPLLKNNGNSASYTDPDLTAGTSYYYKVSAYDTSSNESAASAAKTVSIEARSGGGGSGGGSLSSDSGGGGGGTTAPPPPPAVPPLAPAPVAASTPTSPPVVPIVTRPPQPSLSMQTSDAPSIRSEMMQLTSLFFIKNFERGAQSNDVRRLQQLLATDSEVYPEGRITGYYGTLTEQAVRRFQLKYGIIASEKDPGSGRFGPKTRGKVHEVFAGRLPPWPMTSAPERAKPSPIAVEVSPVFTSGLGRGSRREDVRRLQQLLNRDSDTQVDTTGVGAQGNESDYYGALTEQAVGRFQEKYGIAGPGRPGYGYVGPATRAKLGEVFFQGGPGLAPESQKPPSGAAPGGTQPLTNELRDQIRRLQEQVDALRYPPLIID